MSAGGVVVRPVEGSDPARWSVLLGEQPDRNRGESTVRLPKGHLDPGETNEQAAVREVLEETGHHAVIRLALTDIVYEYYEKKTQRLISKRVHFYLMDDAGDSGERDDEMSRVFWCDIESASDQLTFEAERTVVAQAIEVLAGG